jgi:hypothetical protein
MAQPFSSMLPLRPGQAEAQAQRGGLAGAVRAEQAETGAGFDGERQPGDHVWSP